MDRHVVRVLDVLPGAAHDPAPIDDDVGLHVVEPQFQRADRRQGNRHTAFVLQCGGVDPRRAFIDRLIEHSYSISPSSVNAGTMSEWSVNARTTSPSSEIRTSRSCSPVKIISFRPLVAGTKFTHAAFFWPVCAPQS